MPSTSRISVVSPASLTVMRMAAQSGFMFGMVYQEPVGLGLAGLQICLRARHVSATSWPIEPLWAGESSKTCRRAASFSPRPPKFDRLLVIAMPTNAVSYTHLRAHETRHDL